MLAQKEFAFGDPWRLTEKSLAIVVPILRSQAKKRGYYVIEEVKDKIDFTDTGSIDGVQAKSRADKPVFIRSGSAFGMKHGTSTQPRSVTVGTILFPMTTEILKTVCVHASQGIRTGAGFKYDGLVPHTMLYAVSAADQGETWSQVRHHTESMGNVLMASGGPRARGVAQRISGSDDLVGSMQAMKEVEGFKEKVEDYLTKIPADLEGQVGIAVMDLDGVIGLEIFDHPESWKAFSKSVARSYSEVLMKEEDIDIFELKKERVVSHIVTFLTSLKNVASNIVWDNKKAATAKIETDAIIGEFTELAQQLIHLVITRKEKKHPLHPSRESSILMNLRARGSGMSEVSLNDGRRLEQFITQQKGAGNFLSALAQPQTWGELEDNVDVSTRTLSKIAKRSSELGLTKKTLRNQNGRVTYQLTTLGKEAKKKLVKAEA